MQDHPDKETLDRWHNDPANWKWGIIYYNKEDPRFFLPKRIDWMGVTINFANPNAVIFLSMFTLLVGGFLFAISWLVSH